MGLLERLWSSFRAGRLDQASAVKRRGRPPRPAHSSVGDGSEPAPGSVPSVLPSSAPTTNPPAPARGIVPPPPPGNDPVWDALRCVVDPEVGIDIVSMGLVYGVVTEAAHATVFYTLTTPGCPMDEVLARGIRAAVASVPGLDRIDLQLVWEPAWHPGMIGDTLDEE